MKKALRADLAAHPLGGASLSARPGDFARLLVLSGFAARKTFNKFATANL